MVRGQSRYPPRAKVASKLDPYKGIIEARLREFPKLSAQRLCDEARAAGYSGCYSGVRNYVRTVRPREAVDPVVRFETPAGLQGQVDFGRFVLPWGHRYAVVVVRATRVFGLSPVVRWIRTLATFCSQAAS